MIYWIDWLNLKNNGVDLVLKIWNIIWIKIGKYDILKKLFEFEE